MEQTNKLLRWVIFLLAIIAVNTCNAQRIFVTDNQYEANYQIFITNNRYEADWIIYQTDNQFEADANRGRWFVTKNRYQANYIMYFTDNRYAASDRDWETTQSAS